MGQVADVIKGLETKLADEKAKRVAAETSAANATATISALQAQVAAQAPNLIDDADKAAIVEAQGIIAAQ